MRMMLKFTVPVERGNAAFHDGTLAATVQALMSKVKPEAAYFAPLGGQRSGMMVFDLADPSDIVALGEPLFDKLNASVEFIPVMTAEDLKKGFAKCS